MKMLHFKPLVVLALAGAFMSALGRPGTAVAATNEIAIINPSFEVPGLAPGTYEVGNIPGWTISPGAQVGIQYLTPAQFSGGVPDGTQVAWMNTAGTISQTLAATLSAKTTYKLMVQVGFRNDLPEVGTYEVQLYAGDTLLGSASPPGIHDGFVTAEVDYTVAAKDPLIGSALRIVLLQPNTVYGWQPSFDDVVLLAIVQGKNGNGDGPPPHKQDGAIAIVNPSFEVPGLAPGEYEVGDIPGWTISPGAQVGIQYPLSAQFSGGVPDGTQVAWMNTAGTISQDLPATLAGKTTYKLTVRVGFRNDLPGVGTYAVQLYAGDALLGSASPTGVQNGFVTAEVDYSAAGKDPLIGRPLRIVLLQPSTVYGWQPNFDNVVLLATSQGNNGNGGGPPPPKPTGEITIANPSFETPVLAPGEYEVGDIPGWTISPGAEVGVQNPTSAVFSGALPDGTQVAWMNTAGTISQTLAATLTGKTSYKLTVQVGFRSDLPEVGTYAVQLYAGDTLLGSANPPGIHDGFVTAEVDYTAAAKDPLIGSPLRIVLFQPSTVYGWQPNFDNVNLLATPQGEK